MTFPLRSCMDYLGVGGVGAGHFVGGTILIPK